MALSEQPNPFLREIQSTEPIKVLLRQVTHKLVVDDDTEMNLVNNQDFEADDKLKFYTDSKRKNTIKLLSPSASKLLFFVLFKLEKNQDYVIFSVKEAEGFTGFSINTVHKYIEELEDNALLKRKGREAYWINPRYFFKGNRLEYFKQAQKKFKEIKVLQDPINLTELEEKKRTRKKSEIMKHFGFVNYFELKKKLGVEQIEALVEGTLLLPNVKFIS